MIGYSLLDDDKQPAQQIIKPAPTSAAPRKNTFLKIKTECDLVVLGFVLATILLLLSDINK